MRVTIYLIANRYGIQGMRKNLPDVKRGEIPVKLTITVPEATFAPPVLAQGVTVDDWRQGIELNDVDFRQSVLTPEEAGVIRTSRLAKMRHILEEQG
jgi:hypothetical protein